MRTHNFARSMVAIFASATFSIQSFAQVDSSPNTDSTQRTTTGSQDNPLGALFQGLGNIIRSIVSPKATEAQRLLDEGKPEDAASLIEKEPTLAKGPESAELRAKVSKALDEKQAPALKLSSTSLKELLAKEIVPSGWSEMREAMRQSGETIAAYQKYNFLRSSAAQSPIYGEVVALRTQAAAKLISHGPTALLSSLSDPPTADLSNYPITLGKNLLLQKAGPALREKLSALERPRLTQFWKEYGADLAADDKKWFAELFMGKALQEKTGSDGGFKEVSTTLREAKDLGIPAPEQGASGVAVLNFEPAKSSNREFLIKLDADLSVQIEEMTSAPGERLGPVAARYVVAIKQKLIRVTRKVPEKEEVSSRYESGTTQVPNPAYQQARVNYASAESDYTRQRIQSSTTPTYGLLGALAKGLGDGVSAALRNKAAENLANTPQTLSEPTYTDYKVTVSKVDSTREAQLDIFVVDRTNNRFTRFTQPMQESKRFELAYNVHDKDAGGHRTSSRYSKEEDITKYEQLPMQVKLSALFESVASPPPTLIAKTYPTEVTLVSDMNSIGDDSESATLVALRGSEKSASLEQLKEDPRMHSVVVVKSPKGALGAGFYVGPDLIITDAHVVEGSKFAEIKMFGGRESFGKVLKADVAMDLALIKVNDKGTPVRFIDEQVSVGSTVEAIGHPRSLEFSLTRGVVSAIRKRAALGGKEVVLVQTDAAISPGNSGGPLFLKDRVLGINTLKFTGRGAEGLGFAVHAAEIQRFIATE